VVLKDTKTRDVIHDYCNDLMPKLQQSDIQNLFCFWSFQLGCTKKPMA